MNLLESYKGRLSVAETYYAQKNNGAKLPADKKMNTAICLQNIARFMNEAFTNSVGTQRSDLGDFKRFCMDITTVVMPNLIVSDIFLTKPMASFTGYLSYMKFALGTPKGGIAARTTIQTPFMNGKADADRANYTSDRVVETFATGDTGVAWYPVQKGIFKDDTGVGHDIEIRNASGILFGDFASEDARNKGLFASMVFYNEDGGTTSYTLTAGDKLKYVYDNVVIPQNSLPTLVGTMDGITLKAEARRIAVQYSQIAAFQSKQDYGIDFESTIAQQAQAELQYEVDTEAVLLVKAAGDASTDVVVWEDIEPNTISYSMKAEGFARAIEQAKANFYKKTRKFAPNWMLISPDILPILTFIPGFKATENAIQNGAYLVGTIGGMKVYVSPALIDDTGNNEVACYLGVIGADGKTGTGVFAPYMPLVPTQLLGFADGTMEQGFSSMYDMKILNENLVTKIEVVKGTKAFLGQVEVIESSEVV